MPKGPRGEKRRGVGRRSSWPEKFIIRLSDQSHLDDELTAVVREADRFVNMSDVELSAWMAREGLPAAAATVRRFVNAAFKLDQQSPTRMKPRQQFEDATLMNLCVKAAERVQNAMPTHQS